MASFTKDVCPRNSFSSFPDFSPCTLFEPREQETNLTAVTKVRYSQTQFPFFSKAIQGRAVLPEPAVKWGFNGNAASPKRSVFKACSSKSLIFASEHGVCPACGRTVRNLPIPRSAISASLPHRSKPQFSEGMMEQAFLWQSVATC